MNHKGKGIRSVRGGVLSPRGAVRRACLGLLGIAVLLAALALAACSGAGAAPTKGSSGRSAFTQTQTAHNYSLTLQVSPVSFGANTFTLTLKSATGAPVTGASVRAQLVMLDMDMGVVTASLQPAGASSPGVYSGKGELTMAGHWLVRVNVVPADSSQPVTADFHLTVSYG